MAGNSIGHIFTVTSFGESHGPAIGCVVDFWKNSGTISTMPPTAMVSRINTIIKKLLVSIRSWPETAFCAMACVLCIRVQACAAATGGTGATATLPARTVITTFQAMISMPPR